MRQGTDYYTLLGLTPSATLEEIRRAYHYAARRLHPDYNHYPGETEMFLRVQQAYEILSDPEKRSAYDAELQAYLSQTVPLQVLYSRSLLPILDEPQLLYVLLQAQAPPDFQPQDQPPLNVCLILDHSTSMQGERLDLLKNAAIELVRQLRPQDTLSVVVFSDRAETILPAGRTYSLEEVEAAVRMVRASGATEISHGLEAGFAEVRRGLSPKRINHLLLLTDGQTYGDEAACMQTVSRAAEMGIGLTALGLGEAWNDSFLDELASRTGGSSFYVSRPKELSRFFQNLLDRLGQVYADSIQLELDFPRGVTLQDAYRLGSEPARLAVEMPMRLGSLLYPAGLNLLLELRLEPLLNGPGPVSLANGELRLTIPSHDPPQVQQPFFLTRSAGPTGTMELAPEAVLQAVSKVTLYRLQERARQEVYSGNLERASRLLQHLATHLLFQGERELAQTVLVEAENLQHRQALSTEGEKQMKYGTRSLLLPSRILPERP